MNKLLAVLIFCFSVLMVLTTFPDGGIAFLILAPLTSLIVFFIYKKLPDNEFIIRFFFIALLVRLSLGIFIHFFDFYDFFAGDALTYDFLGNRLLEIFNGTVPTNDFFSQRALNMETGWGMNYFVAGIYLITGQSIFTAQSVSALIGASIVPVIYLCSYEIYSNKRVARITSILAAVYPAFIIWTGQLLKDGSIIFLLVLSITLTLQILKKPSLIKILVLIITLASLISLRFYIFYMVVCGIIGAFIIKPQEKASSVLRNLLILVMLGLGLTYIGVLRGTSEQIEKYTSLQRIQEGRAGLAKSAESGYGEDLDVSTPTGAIAALPIGFAYLMLAPFPWQVTNFRQMITLPEVFLWWALIPFICYGLWYTIKFKWKNAIAILIFVLMLVLGYSLYQGNVGTAYRQRTQIQVFLFIFAAVGITLFQEKSESRRITKNSRR